MCLNAHWESTGKMRARLAVEQVQFYKCYRVVFAEPRYASAPYRAVSVHPENGVISSDRQSAVLTKTEAQRGEVENGIHVFAKEQTAIDAMQGGDYFVIAVTVKAEDFVACDVDQNHAVFMKVHVDEEKFANLIANATQDDDDEDEDYDDEEDEEDEDDYEDDEDDYEDEEDYVCPSCGVEGCEGECEDEEEDDEEDEDDDDEWEDDEWEDEDDDYDEDDDEDSDEEDDESDEDDDEGDYL